MKLCVLALFDEKVGAFMTPFFAQSVGAGVRSLSDMVNGSEDQPPAKHPEDFSLYQVGDWFDDGQLMVGARPELVAKCVDLKVTLKLER